MQGAYQSLRVGWFFGFQSLFREFALGSAIIIVAGMVVLGAWLTYEIRRIVIENAAFASAIFMERHIQPLVQDLAVNDKLSAKSVAALDELIRHHLIFSDLRSVKIWLPDGTIVYSTFPSLVGKRFPISDGMKAAVAGKISSDRTELDDDENVRERSLQVLLIEVYVPMHDSQSDRVIAISEFYLDAGPLFVESPYHFLDGWLVVAAITLAMLLVIGRLILKADRTIELQQQDLREKVRHLSVLLSENQLLTVRVDAAAREAVTIIENYLRRIGAELHDGPAQALALASLRLSALDWSGTSPEVLPHDIREKVRGVQSNLSDAMTDIRSIAAGLMMPEVAKLTTAEVLDLAATVHERRTGSKVSREFADLPSRVPEAVKTSLYRFVQEALSNATRHGKDLKPKLSGRVEGRCLIIEVSDTGPGFAWNIDDFKLGKLGIVGLKNRIATLGGDLSLASLGSGTGTTITARLPLKG